MTKPPIATGGKTIYPAIAELAGKDRWVVWKVEHRRTKNGEVKETKPPFCIGGRRKAKSNDPGTWGSFDLCYASAFVDRAAQGIGFVLGDGYVGADLDGCVADGVVHPWALEIVRKLNSYTEVSPSGTGLHIIWHGEMDGPGRKVGKLEVYPRDRFFTVTAHHLPGTPITINDVAPEVVEALLGQKSGKADGPSDNLWDRFAEACAWDATLEARWHGEPPQGEDQSRSAWDMSLARLLRRYGGFTLEDFTTLADSWEYGTGADGDARQRRRAWDRAGEDEESEEPTAQTDEWPEPDLTVLSDHHISAPALPLTVFGDYWAGWIRIMAECKSCAPDYVAAGLLSIAGSLIGTARWGAPWDSWAEPPIIWSAGVGNPSSGKSPGLDASLHLVAALEAKTNEGYAGQVNDWKTQVTVAKIKRELWEAECKNAVKKGFPAPDKPEGAEASDRPIHHRLLTNDPTIEKMARLVLANPKGMLLFRDELAGWIGALDKYGGAGSDRAFYLEAYGARRYSVDRVKDAEPIVVPELAISISGGIQPDRLATMILHSDDDGLAARFLYYWPERVSPRRPARPAPSGAQTKLGALYALEPMRDMDGRPVPLRFMDAAAVAIQAYREQVADQERSASGLFLSWLGKLPGMALRLAVAFEHLYWCGDREGEAPPTTISERATVAAIAFLDAYAVPMACRCFGEAALPQADRDAIGIARWIAAQEPIPALVNTRNLRQHHAPIGRDAKRYDVALAELADAGWFRQPPVRRGVGRPPKEWAVNPKLKDALS